MPEVTELEARSSQDDGRFERVVGGVSHGSGNDGQSASQLGCRDPSVIVGAVLRRDWWHSSET